MLNLAFQQSKGLAQEVHEVISYGFKIKFITYCNIPNFVSNYDRNKRKSIGTILTRQDMPYKLQKWHPPPLTLCELILLMMRVCHIAS